MTLLYRMKNKSTGMYFCGLSWNWKISRYEPFYKNDPEKALRLLENLRTTIKLALEQDVLKRKDFDEFELEAVKIEYMPTKRGVSMKAMLDAVTRKMLVEKLKGEL